MLTREQIWEIRSSYRNAIDPKKQIGILAELYDTSKSEICKALELQPKPRKRGKTPRKYDPALKAAVLNAVLLEGLSYQQAGEKFSVPYGSVAAWGRNERRKFK